MTRSDSARQLREVKLAHMCSHPIRITGEMVDVATGELSRRTLRIGCRDRRHVICPACSYLYQGDAWILTTLGLRGGTDVPLGVVERPRLFATLTAPAFGRVHNEHCADRHSSQRGVERCRHNRPSLCGVSHSPDDPTLGTPLCPECFDYSAAVLWNAHLSRLWNRTTISLRREVATAGDIPVRQLNGDARINFIKVAELQRRGLVHLHVIVRADGPHHVDSLPPAWLDSPTLLACLVRVIREVRIVGLDLRERRWGDQFSVSDLGTGDLDPGRVANYIAKYATKTAGGGLELARRFQARSQIERLAVPEHLRTLALTSWDLGQRSDLETLKLRSHAHTFGYTGQLITKSRGYSTTFAALRAKRASFTRPANEFAVVGGFGYDGRGYSDPRSAELARVVFDLRHELRQERSRRLREGAGARRSPGEATSVGVDEVRNGTPAMPPMSSDIKGRESL